MFLRETRLPGPCSRLRMSDRRLAARIYLSSGSLIVSPESYAIPLVAPLRSSSWIDIGWHCLLLLTLRYLPLSLYIMGPVVDFRSPFHPHPPLDLLDHRILLFLDFSLADYFTGTAPSNLVHALEHYTTFD